MRTLGVSEEHVVDAAEGALPTHLLDRDDTAGVRLVYNQTNPNLHSDGVDVITVVRRGPDRYRVVDSGFHRGHLTITAAGARELGERYLNDRDEIPHWVVDADTIDDDRPEWFPAGFGLAPPLDCAHCGTATPPDDVVTPAGRSAPPRYCRDWWRDQIVRFPG